MSIQNLYSNLTVNMKSSMIRDLVHQTKGVPGMISFAGGFPSPKTFPTRKLADVFEEVVATEGVDVLQYGASEGDTHLKKQILKHEGMKEVTEKELLITAGATNGLYLYTRTFIDVGDVIFTEAPSFVGSLVAFEGAGAELAPVEMDDHGMRVDLLKKSYEEVIAAGKRPKFIYLIPEFQNPTGISMTLERKREIIAFAIEKGLLILEDNPYGELRYAGNVIPSLFEIARREFDNIETVTMVKSFSKLLGPGLRLAYIMSYAPVISKMCSWIQKVSVTPECIVQRAIARYMEKGEFEPHVDSVKSFYHTQCKAMLDTLEESMPSYITWTKPEGGMFIWITLPETMNGDELFTEALKHKVAFVPGSKFYPTGHEKFNAIRLNYSYATVEQIHEGVKRLAVLIREQGGEE